MATLKDEVLMVMLVLKLEVLMNHIGLDDEDTLGSSVESFDGMTYKKKTCEFIDIKYFEEKVGCGEGGIRMRSMKLKIIRRRSYNLT